MAKLTPQQARQQSFQDLANQVQGGLSAGRFSPGRQGGGALGGMMAFMDMPNLAARPHYGYGTPDYMGGGQQDPFAALGGGGGGHSKPPGTGGNDPGTDPNNPDSAMQKAGLPSWWIDWLHTNGQYGVWNKPPAGGLLD